MYPSVKTISARLNLSPSDAKLLRNTMEYSVCGGDVDKVLSLANRLLNAHGIEAIRDNEWDKYHCDIGLLYVNMGDTYNTTLMYDTRKGKFIVGCWGDIVEREEKRFRDS